jgi:predicted 3-demethylubiquinone-9 3-methyltransferase (glyoxalase superfamily)
MAKKITPCLLYTKDAAKAAKFYTSIFKDGKILSSDAVVSMFRIGGQEFMALNGPAQKFTLAVSFMIDCKDQKEVDYFWNKLSKDGKEIRCGWVQDKYGMAWQVVPSILPKLFGAKDRTKANRAIQAMMKMKKLDIAKLKAAFDGK